MERAAYSNLQIVLHWAVAFLVLCQWLTAGAIGRTHHVDEPSAVDLFLHALHNYGGMLIGALVALRIAIRLARRTQATTGPSTVTDRIANIVHAGLYASLLAQAATGFVAGYLWGGAASIHTALWNATLGLLALHVGAALFHAARRDGTIRRILPAGAGR